MNTSFAAFDPRESGTALHARDLVVLAVWAVAATALAVRGFRWEPHS